MSSKTVARMTIAAMLVCGLGMNSHVSAQEAVESNASEKSAQEARLCRQHWEQLSKWSKLST